MALGPETITHPVDGKDISPEIKAAADAIEAAFDSEIKSGHFIQLEDHYLNGVSVEHWFSGSFPIQLRDEVERRYLNRWKLVKLLQFAVVRGEFCLTLILLNPPERDRLRAEQFLNLVEEQRDRLFRAAA